MRSANIPKSQPVRSAFCTQFSANSHCRVLLSNTHIDSVSLPLAHILLISYPASPYQQSFQNKAVAGLLPVTELRVAGTVSACWEWRNKTSSESDISIPLRVSREYRMTARRVIIHRGLCGVSLKVILISSNIVVSGISPWLSGLFTFLKFPTFFFNLDL